MTGAVITSAISNSSTTYTVGSVVTSLPANCTLSTVGGIAYRKCGNTWFMPQYSGTMLQYVVVLPPN